MHNAAALVTPGTMPSHDADTVRQMVRNINQAWLMERFEELEQYLHPEAIFVQPRFAGRLEGRAACIASYRDFAAQAQVREYRDGTPTVDVFGNTAVASYPFHILYELAGETYRENGYDTFVFTRDEEGWRAVWRNLFINSGVSA
jgi:predicted lipid-binding transport protein (Tim44 family)